MLAETAAEMNMEADAEFLGSIKNKISGGINSLKRKARAKFNKEKARMMQQAKAKANELKAVAEVELAAKQAQLEENLPGILEAV